jgi:recombination protein RecR
MSKPIQELALIISEFPGIGPRQARRIVQFLLGKDGRFREKLALLIKEIREKTAQCKVCFRYDDAKTNGTCSICADAGRESHELMAVEKDVDIESIEMSGAYRGRYFVLGGLLSMTQKKNGAPVRRAELLERVQKNGITEIILAFPTTPEGDYTAREFLTELSEKFKNVKTTMLGRGLSVGAEIEYADSETLRSAFKNRS